MATPARPLGPPTLEPEVLSIVMAASAVREVEFPCREFAIHAFREFKADAIQPPPITRQRETRECLERYAVRAVDTGLAIAVRLEWGKPDPRTSAAAANPRANCALAGELSTAVLAGLEA